MKAAGSGVFCPICGAIAPSTLFLMDRHECKPKTLNLIDCRRKREEHQNHENSRPAWERLKDGFAIMNSDQAKAKVRRNRKYVYSDPENANDSATAKSWFRDKRKPMVTAQRAGHSTAEYRVSIYRHDPGESLRLGDMRLPAPNVVPIIHAHSVDGCKALLAALVDAPDLIYDVETKSYARWIRDEVKNGGILMVEAWIPDRNGTVKGTSVVPIPTLDHFEPENRPHTMPETRHSEVQSGRWQCVGCKARPGFVGADETRYPMCYERAGVPKRHKVR